MMPPRGTGDHPNDLYFGAPFLATKALGAIQPRRIKPGDSRAGGVFSMPESPSIVPGNQQDSISLSMISAGSAPSGARPIRKRRITRPSFATC